MVEQVVIHYTYDALYRLTRADYSDGRYFVYTYDAVGNRLTEEKCVLLPCTLPITNTYVYDSANRLTSVNGQTYQWDDNGNLLNDGVSTYTYDAANRLTSVTQGTTLSSYTYNGLGDRLSQTVDSATTNYVLDLNAGLTQVLADGTNTYLYGNGRIGELQAAGFAYYLGDALGSVRQLTGGTGGVTLAKSYEPYGSPLTRAGTGSSVFSFTGEQWDSQTNLLYLRARFYAAYLNQWIQPDTIIPDWSDPRTLNRYVYSLSNPVNYTDPSGLIPCAEGQSARFCLLANGGYLDIAHFGESKRHGQGLLEIKLPKVMGKRFGEVTLDQVFSKLPRYTFVYYTNIPPGIDQDTLVRVALGIFLDFQYGYELAQGFDPRCVSNWGHPEKGYGHCSSFSNEDLPSDYLGFVSAAKGLSFEEIVRKLGGGEQLDQQNPPAKYWPTGSESWLEPARCGLGDCGENTPYNNQCTLKVYDPSTRRYVNRPWPAELTITPTGFGTYWGRHTTDFAERPPSPPSSAPQQTPRPPGGLP